MSNNHIGHEQHVFGKPSDYCAPICNVLTKLQARLPISHNEMILFKLAIDLGELDRYMAEKPEKPEEPEGGTSQCLLFEEVQT